jgi:hypothetical protein
VYCQYCGTQLPDSALFCSRCGRPTNLYTQPAPSTGAAAAPAPVVPACDPLETLAGQVRVLGILWLVYSIFRLMLSSGGILFGRAMTHMSFYVWPPNLNPYRSAFMPLMRGIFLFAEIASLITGILGICAAVVLLRRDPSGRTVAMVAACVALISFPFGTALGIYTLVVLLHHGAAETYARLTTHSA